MPGITHLEEFQPEALRALVDVTVEEAESTFADRFLPTETTFNRRFAYDIVKTSKYIAGYIGYGAEPPVMDRNALASKAGDIAYFGLKDIITYEELQAINEARNDDERGATVDAILNKNIDLVEGLQRLIYVAKMEALFKGRHDYITGEKNPIRFDFGVPAENKIALTAGNDFESDGFDIIGFLQTQDQAYRNANNGRAPEVMITSASVRAVMQRNSTIIAESGKPDTATRVSVTELNEVLANFDLPALQLIGDRQVTVKDIQTGDEKSIELVPENRITFLSEGIGTYLLGPTLENNFRPGLFLEAKDKDEPIRSILRGVGAGLPAPTQPSLIFHMDVYTPA